MERTDELKERIRQQPLSDRLEESRRRIGDMCSKGRCPKMTIPVQHDDDDFYINTTLADAQETIAALQARVQELRKVIERVAHHGPIMGSRGEYRQGQLDVLESVRRIVQEELYGSHQITG